MTLDNLDQTQDFSPSKPTELVKYLDFIQSSFQQNSDKEKRSELGQFFTPSTVSCMMADMFQKLEPEITLLDAGAGFGILSASFISRVLANKPYPKSIHIIAYEIDPTLFLALQDTLNYCRHFCIEVGIKMSFEIKQQDFISACAEGLYSKGSLFPKERIAFNYAIINPPYRKINNSSKEGQILRSIGIETTNLYSAFLWLVMRSILPGGEIVAIVPRSFCNGTYYKPFRQELLQSMAITHIHEFHARDKAFKEDNVLQENIVFHTINNKNMQGKVLISSNSGPEDPDLKKHQIEYVQLVQPDDPDQFIRIVVDRNGHQINALMDTIKTPIHELGINISTGAVVDFRSKEFLQTEKAGEVIPLLYPHHLKNGFIEWPSNSPKKPEFLKNNLSTRKISVPSQCYVLVKRFSSKEEKRRVYAAIYDPFSFQHERIGIENHLNFFHKSYGGLDLEIAKGLVLYLNSSIVDHYFRQFSGHTQVNASDLRNLKYPNEAQLRELGSKVGNQFPDQDSIDKLISDFLLPKSKEGDYDMDDPIQAKKKIKQALNILHLLNVPNQQQNDRSALTLLALANIKISDDWNKAKQNLIGITEMMDYFKKQYGVEYAPNTRETIRRQTIHQFIQLGMVHVNPDNPERPINSPKTRYLLDLKVLELLRSYKTNSWDLNLTTFLKDSKSIARLQIRERQMPMIPVSLPDGSELLLSSGGQNSLIKDIIEKFCPRYTPGGAIVYVGDAGEKLNESELNYFAQLGIKLDRHGKIPDIVIDLPDKKWLVLIEAVTSHGTIDIKRHNELKDLFRSDNYGLVFVTAFESRKIMNKYLRDIAWETEVWVAESPSHLIHFNGEKFLGPYLD